jgi:hypothetical protein
MGVPHRVRVFAVVAALGVVAAACDVPAPLPKPGGTATGGGPVVSGPTLAGCPVFPADNAWNQRVDTLPVRADSRTFIASISASGKTNLHPDFGGGGAYGIPFMVVPSTQPKVPIHFTAYGDESDPGPYPVPGNAPVEGGSASTGDRHVLVLQQGTCHLYEMGRAFWQGTYWNADINMN